MRTWLPTWGSSIQDLQLHHINPFLGWGGGSLKNLKWWICLSIQVLRIALKESPWQWGTEKERRESGRPEFEFWLSLSGTVTWIMNISVLLSTIYLVRQVRIKWKSICKAPSKHGQRVGAQKWWCHICTGQKPWGCPEVAWPRAPEVWNYHRETRALCSKGAIQVRSQLQDARYKKPNCHHLVLTTRKWRAV